MLFRSVMLLENNWLKQEGILISVIVFFFQAEEGIRYPLVTGVQTCALPILLVGLVYTYLPFMNLTLYASLEPLDRSVLDAVDGRASCRE